MHGSSNVAPVPSGRDQFVTNSRPVVLYHAAAATVTTLFFESAGLRYPVEELLDVERVEHGGLWQGRCYELWADYRGQRVRLFRTHDAREFGQVCRALMRAREHAGLA